jgi:hypothetical protein
VKLHQRLLGHVDTPARVVDRFLEKRVKQLHALVAERYPELA